MSKIIEAIEALAHNATHPKFITAALTEIKEELDALKQRVEGLDQVKARAAQSASVALTPAPTPAQTPAPAAEVVDPVTPAAPAVPAAPVAPPVTA